MDLMEADGNKARETGWNRKHQQLGTLPKSTKRDSLLTPLLSPYGSHTTGHSPRAADALLTLASDYLSLYLCFTPGGPGSQLPEHDRQSVDYTPTLLSLGATGGSICCSLAPKTGRRRVWPHSTAQRPTRRRI